MSINKSYRLFDKVIIRNPLYPIKEFEKSNQYKDFVKFMSDYWSNPRFRNGVLLSSYDIYTEIDNCINKTGSYSDQDREKIFHTFFKYFTRVCSRPTPFGLFSNMSCELISDLSDTCNSNNFENQNYISFELHYDLIHQMAVYLSIKYKELCIFRLNSSLTLKGNVIQYTIREIYDEKSIYKTRSVEFNEIIEYFVNNKNKEYLYSHLVEALCSKFPYYDSADIKEFIDDCLESEIFYNIAMPSGRGEFSNHQIIFEEIQRIYQNYSCRNLQFLLDIFEIIGNLNEEKNLKLEVDKISSILNGLNISHSLDRILFINSYKKTNNDLQLNEERLISYMLDAINALTRFTTLETSDNWFESFQKAFKSIYGDAMIPFDVVFDPLIGLGYPLSNKKDTEQEVLLSEIDVPNKMQSTGFITAKQKFWFEKYLNCISNGNEEIEILEKDLLELPRNIPQEDYTFPMLISVIKDPDDKISDPHLYIKSATAGSAISYLGRFSPTNSEISDLCSEIADFERTINEDKIVAEITHIPNPKIGDILYHKSFHQYEIPYLVQSNTDGSRVIDMEDLYLGIQNEEFVIFSKKHNRYVMPILANAYNFSLSEHPAFMFLCDFQHRKSIYSPNLPLGSWTSERTFFPRVRYKNIIFMPKTWTFTKDLFTSGQMTNKKEFIRQLRATYPNIPDQILLGQGDQQLLIDFKNEFSCRLFYNHCKKKFSNNVKRIEISESFQPITSYSNELLLSYGYSKN